MPFNPPNTKPTNMTKHCVSLLQKAHDTASTFLGKYMFGLNKTSTDVLPPLVRTPPSHRDMLYIKGKLRTYY
jgi:hypothetical protein